MGDDQRATFAAEVRRRRGHRRQSLADVASLAYIDRTHLSHVEHGRRWPSRAVAVAVDTALDAGGALVALWDAIPSETAPLPVDGADDAAFADLAALAEATDVTPTALDTIDVTVDALARDYARADPTVLLDDVRVLARRVGALLGGRSTLAERRRLMVAGGWLALLAATVHIDLDQRRQAATARTVAASLDREAEHGEIGAWAVEIHTWAALVDQDWRRADALAEAGENIAPPGPGQRCSSRHSAPGPPHGSGTAPRCAARSTGPPP